MSTRRPLNFRECAFACQSCARLVFFENTVCLHCAAELGFVWPDRELVVAAAPRCAYEEIAACNWLVEQAGELCFACGLTRTRLADEEGDGCRRFAGPKRPSAG